MNAAHWQGVYGRKRPDEVSWYAPHLGPSLASLRAFAKPDAKILDVGGGASTLVDDLLAVGYADVSVLDLSALALDVAKARLGDAARRVTWLVGDVTGVELRRHAYDLWHDRAVFHFLTEASDRAAYVRRVDESLKVGGHVVIETFAPDGPERCSGLPVARYDAATLARELGPHFALVEDLRVTHRTPAGAEQKLIHCVFEKRT